VLCVAGSLDDHEKRLPFLDDIRGELRGVFAAAFRTAWTVSGGTIKASPAL